MNDSFVMIPLITCLQWIYPSCRSH